MVSALHQARAFPGRTTRNQEVADALGVSNHSLNQSLKRVKTNKGQVPQRHARAQEMMRRIDAGEHPRDIAASMGHSPNYVYRQLKRYRTISGVNKALRLGWTGKMPSQQAIKNAVEGAGLRTSAGTPRITTNYERETARAKAMKRRINLKPLAAHERPTGQRFIFQPFAQRKIKPAGPDRQALHLARQALPQRLSKSYVPGVGWRSASKLTARQRALVPGGHAKAMGMSRKDKAFQRNWERGKKEMGDMSVFSGVHHDPESWTSGGATVRIGGAKTGKSYVTGQARTRGETRQVAAHEGLHAAPQRSSYRLHAQIHPNKVKLMREEARADYGSVGHYSNPRNTSGYAGTARHRERALARPNHPAKGSLLQAKVIREWQPDFQRVTNQRAYQGQLQQTFGAVNYRATQHQADKAIDAYRDLHNQFRAKGLPERRAVNKKLGARLGAHYTVRLTHLADKLEPKAPPRLPKGRLSVIHPRNGIHLGRTATANSLRRTAVNPASLLKDQELTDQQFLLFKRFSPVRKSFVPGKGYVRAVDLAENDIHRLKSSAFWRDPKHRDKYAIHHHMSRGLRASTRGEKYQNPDAEYGIYREAIKGIKDEVLSGRDITTMKGKRGALNRVEFNRGEMPLGAEAFAVHIGGRKGQRIMVVQPNANPRAVTHEAAHLSPKRDSWRHYQMTRDPQRMMREEARADMSSGSDYKSYKQSRNQAKTHSGYSQFAVDESARKTGEMMSTLGNPFGQKQYTPEAMGEYRRIQDKIRDAKGGEVADPNIGLPPPMSTKRKIAILTAAGGMAAGGGATYYHRDALGRFARQKGTELKERATEAIGKSYQPWDGVRSEVSKIGPPAMHESIIRMMDQGKSAQQIADAHGISRRSLTRHAKLIANDRWFGVKKSFTPWEGIHSEVSKMGPDASEVHVMGGISRQTKQRKKPRFKRITTQ